MPCLRSFSVKFLFYILFYIMYARVWETGAALLALLAPVFPGIGSIPYVYRHRLTPTFV